MFDSVQAIKDFIQFPSVSTDPEFQEGMEGARDYIIGLLTDIGLSTETVSTPRHPVVIAKREGPSEWPHVVIYGHYDVQPADPLELWKSEPFDPIVKNGRLYGRGAADNKGPMMTHIAGFAKLMEEYPDAPLRVTFLLEGEEEIGSPSLPAVLKEKKSELQGDFVLVSDTLSPSTTQIAVTTGLRGMVSFEVFLEGPNSDLHSGIHGGALRNPIQALVELCGSLHDENGKVTVPGFYDDVIEPLEWESAEIQKLGISEEAYYKTIGVEQSWTTNNLHPMEATRLMPTLEFNGITGGYQGEGEKTIVPAKASAKISCRLVANQTPEDIWKKVEAALIARKPKGVKMRIVRGHDGPPYMVVPPEKINTPDDQNVHLAKAFKLTEKAVSQEFGKPPLFLREGGSIPIIGTIKEILGMDSLLIGMFTPEDNLHAPNESFDLQMFQKGVNASCEILKGLANYE